MFKIQENKVGGESAEKALSATLRGLKAQQVQSPGQRPGYQSPFPTPCKGKSKSQPFAHTFALTGRGRLYADTQGVALGYELAALSGRSQRRFELIEFLQRGCGLRRSSLVGLRRRNNEFNELPGRSGAGNCPCKGLIFQDRGLPLSHASAHRFSLLPL